MRIRELREARSWSQADLATRSGVPRATIGAIERGACSPSVAHALALARALGSTVERVFAPPSLVERWAIQPASEMVRFHAAEIGGRLVAYPAEALLVAPHASDGLAAAGSAAADMDAARRTLVIATCDPAARILAAALESEGVRLLAIDRSSRDAIGLLEDGLVHAAGLHLATSEAPDENRRAARSGVRRLVASAATWETGVAHAGGFAGNASRLLAPDVRWVNRPPGSGARACLDRWLEREGRNRPCGYEREARDHRAVADIVSAGFAEAGVSFRSIACERKLGFTPLESERYEICFDEGEAEDPRLLALTAALQSRDYARALATVPGFSPLGGAIDAV